MGVSEKHCFHCGEHCSDNSILIGDKYFCCNGCKAVFQLLNGSDLCEYYEIDKKAGITPNIDIVEGRFSYLDDESITSQLLEFRDGKMSTVTFSTPTMHCASCIWLLEKLYSLHKGVLKSVVNFPRKEVSITFNQELISLSELAALLTSIGYEPQISLESIESKERSHVQRKLYYKIGIAGFAFGNVMLLSFPEYISRTGEVDPIFKMVFGYLSILFSLPVFFYSALDYFKSAWGGLKQKDINIDVPITLGIGILFSRSVYEIISQTGAGYLDSFTGLVFFLLIGKVFQQKTYDALSFDKDYKSYFPLAITKLIDKHETIVPVTTLEKGDRILMRNQELIPADAILMSQISHVDYSFVTGESDPIEKMNGDMIYAGGRHIGAAVEMEILKEPSQSYLTRLWNNDIFTKSRRPQLSKKVDELSKYFTFSILLIAFSAFVYWYSIDTAIAVKSFTAVLIVACPCALALSSPFAFGSAMRIFAKHRFYIKNIESIEALTKIDTIVFDKTGTLTQSNLDYIEFKGDILNKEEQSWVKSVVRHSTHPLSLKIFDVLKDSKYFGISNFEEQLGKGLKAKVQKQEIMLGSAKWIDTNIEGVDVEAKKSHVFLSINGDYKGYFAISHHFRPGLRDVISNLFRDYSLFLLSGDVNRSQSELENIFGGSDKLGFEKSPQDKMDFIQSIRSEGKTVLMIGDGLNDAGALQASEVGIAITDDIGSFSPACDAILSGDELPNLSKFLHFSKATMNIVLISFGISILYNVIGISFAVTGHLSPLISAILMPISSVTVVAFTTFATIFKAKMLRLN